MMNENLNNLENAVELDLDQMEDVAGGKTVVKGTLKTTGNVNIRKGPGLDYKEITAVPSGTKLDWTGATATDERGVKWYKVVRNGKTGWVSSKYAKKI